MIRLHVPGVPQPKGSHRLLSRGDRLVALEPPAHVAWQEAVTWAARAAMRHREPVDGPVALNAVFTMPRPRRPRWDVPAVKPDIDKLLRCLLDGLSRIAYTDDARVVRLVVEERYGEPGVECEVAEA